MLIPSSETSRPQPDCLNPPKGSAASTTPWQLIHTEPASSRAASLCARLMSRGQAVAAVVGDAQRLVHVLERDRAYHRPEDLLLEDLHRRVCVREYGWFDEVALVSAALAPGDQLRALRHARFAVGQHPVLLLLGDERT